jgi:transcriptional regulator with XRE-family HTH domain
MVRKTKSNDGLAEVMRAARLARKLTQEQLAEKVNLSLRYITFLENENKKPSFTTLYKLIRYFGIDANSIFYPENATEDTPVARLSRLLLQCDEREIKAFTAHVETLLSEKK